jgi:tripartite-type tricarboxylate transporter receptor subunit TctC
MNTRYTVFALLVFVAGNALAQSFPARPVTLICPCGPNSATNEHLRGMAAIASKYLGQSVIVENKPDDGHGTFGAVTMARTAPPDGYMLAELQMGLFRVPHMTRVTWDPLKDFTYVIGVAGFNFGVVVKSDSQIKTLKDLIDYAMANPGRLSYGTGGNGRSDTGNLNMVELGMKTGARFLHVPSRGAKALAGGNIMALSSGTGTGWAPYVDAGTFRLLVTFGERRSRWNAPTAMELGFDILSYAPFGIVGPKGMDPNVTKILHDAFYKSLDDPEYDKLMSRLDLVDWYKSSEDYAEWAVDQFRFQRELIKRTTGFGR